MFRFEAWICGGRGLRKISDGWRAVCLIVCLLGLSACSGLSKKPEISLAGVELVGIGRVEQRFVLRLNVRNPNAVDLSLKALDFEVELDGKHFARGSAAKPMVIPSQGEAVLEVQAASNLAAVVQQLRSARKNGREKVSYRIFGTAEVEGLGRLPFERRGELPGFCSNCSSVGGRNGSSSDDRPL